MAVISKYLSINTVMTGNRQEMELLILKVQANYALIIIWNVL